MATIKRANNDTKHYTEKHRSCKKNPAKKPSVNTCAKYYTTEKTHNENALNWTYKSVRYIPMILYQHGNLISMKKYNLYELLSLLTPAERQSLTLCVFIKKGLLPVRTV